MDTLHVFASQSGGSRHSSRTPSPSRYEQQQMSRDRESHEDSGTPGPAIVTPSNLRYRNQSPSTTAQRRSRERERVVGRDGKDSLNQSLDMTADHTEIYHDESSRLQEMLGHPSVASEDLEFTDSEHKMFLMSTPSSTNRPHRTNSIQAIDRLSTKIACTKESIKREQTARDDNVNEYLKLAASADKSQLQRIKAVFEKKNQKSAHNIQQLQKKLESYSKRYSDLEQQQMLKAQQQKDHRQPREVLRDVGQGLKNVGGNIRDGVTTSVASVMSKPREFAHLIKNKFGSADNINQMSTSWYTGEEGQGQGVHPSDYNIAEGEQGNAHHGNTTHGGPGSSGKFSGEQESECSSVTSDSNPGLFLKCKHGSAGSAGHPTNNHNNNGTSNALSKDSEKSITAALKAIQLELQERKEDLEKLKEKNERLEAAQKELADLSQALENERYRSERLEVQVNDLTELHQNEIENLKQTIADMEEKVQYQSDERLRDVHEVLENCTTRIQKLEHLSQQQFTVEGIDNSNARALVVKLINVVLTILQVVLLLTATAAGIIMPFLKTRVRVLTTIISVFILLFILRAWPDVREILFHSVRRLKETLIVKSN